MFNHDYHEALLRELAAERSVEIAVAVQPVREENDGKLTRLARRGRSHAMMILRSLALTLPIFVFSIEFTTGNHFEPKEYESDDFVALASEEVAIRSVFPHEIDTYDPYEGEVMVWQS